jgi:hypothetical protein
MRGRLGHLSREEAVSDHDLVTYNGIPMRRDYAESLRRGTASIRVLRQVSLRDRRLQPRSAASASWREAHALRSMTDLLRQAIRYNPVELPCGS